MEEIRDRAKRLDSVLRDLTSLATRDLDPAGASHLLEAVQRAINQLRALKRSLRR